MGDGGRDSRDTKSREFSDLTVNVTVEAQAAVLVVVPLPHPRVQSSESLPSPLTEKETKKKGENMAGGGVRAWTQVLLLP